MRLFACKLHFLHFLLTVNLNEVRSIYIKISCTTYTGCPEVPHKIHFFKLFMNKTVEHTNRFGYFPIFCEVFWYLSPTLWLEGFYF